MSFSKQKSDFLLSQAAAEIKKELIKMESSAKYNTKASFIRSSYEHPDNEISFADKHLEYLANHPDTNPKQYLANLRLKTRIC